MCIERGWVWKARKDCGRSASILNWNQTESIFVENRYITKCDSIESIQKFRTYLQIPITSSFRCMILWVIRCWFSNMEKTCSAILLFVALGYFIIYCNQRNQDFQCFPPWQWLFNKFSKTDLIQWRILLHIIGRIRSRCDSIWESRRHPRYFFLTSLWHQITA